MIPRRGFRALAALADVVDAGVPVTMIAGNHDCWGGDVLRKDVGRRLPLRPVGRRHRRLARRASSTATDCVRRRIERYRALRRVLRNPLAIRSFRWLHPDLATPLAIGQLAARAARTAPRDGGRGLRDAAERIARRRSRRSSSIVFGPLARRDARAAARAAPCTANPGSWLDAPTFLRITDERVALRQWDGSAESADLHTLHRSAEKALP